MDKNLKMKKIKGSIVKWGIIGVGDVCEVKSAPAMQLIENSELVAVMRRNGEKAKDYADRHHVNKWYDSAASLIEDPEVNAIYIATPPNAHAAYTKMAAQAGKPVYVEKPMAKTTLQCREMIEACALADVPLYVAYYRRRLPNFEKVKSLLASSTIGDVRLVTIQLYQTVDPNIVANMNDAMSSNWRVNPEISGGGYFFDLAAHQLDYLDYIFGPITEVNGIATNQGGLYPAADNIQGNFKFENGIVGNGSWCFNVGPNAEKDELIITGSEGQIRISFFGAPKVYLECKGKEVEVFEFEMPKHIQQPLIQTVVDDLMGVGECPSTGTSALRTNWVMEEMTYNYYKSL